MECDSDPCINGTCNEMFGGFNCTCEPGFTGTLCETGECYNVIKMDKLV